MRNRWTYEKVIEESKKYSSKTEFTKKCVGAYHYALKHNFLNEMTWLLNKQNYFICGNNVYVYEDNENKVVYLGLTINKTKRDYQHRTTQTSAVYKYFNSIHKEIPKPIYLIENESKINAQYWESWYVKEYQKQGYTILNKGKTGVGVGSIGATRKLWTKSNVFKHAKEFIHKIDFREKYPSAYAVAQKNGWLKEMDWFRLKRDKRKWDKENVFEESKKYNSRSEFSKNCHRGYETASKNKWLDEMTWLIPKLNDWNKESVFEESKKFTTIADFRSKSRVAYIKSYENNWLSEMTWLEYKRKKWSKEDIIELAKACSNRTQLAKKHFGAYKVAKDNGWLDLIFSK